MIRCLERNEYEQAILLSEQIIMNEKDADLNETMKNGILSYLRQHFKEFSYIASFDEKMNGVLIYEEDTFRIVLLLVKQEDRHRDIASSLLDELKQQAMRINISKISVNAAGSLERFYQSNGFEAAGERKDDGRLRIVPMEYYLGRNQLGKIVKVIVERQYGSFHPTISDLQLPYNFGYVQNDITMEDMQFQDAYVIGITEPLDSFTGEVAGIIYHMQDEKSRWIIAPRGMKVDHDVVIQLIGAEEQYYDTKIIWSE